MKFRCSTYKRGGKRSYKISLGVAGSIYAKDHLNTEVSNEASYF